MNSSETDNTAVRIERIVTLITVVVPFVALVAAVVLLWQHGVTRADLVVCAGMYLVTVAGITLGVHRLFTHRSFHCVSAVR